MRPCLILLASRFSSTPRISKYVCGFTPRVCRKTGRERPRTRVVQDHGDFEWLSQNHPTNGSSVQCSANGFRSIRSNTRSRWRCSSERLHGYSFADSATFAGGRMNKYRENPKSIAVRHVRCFSHFKTLRLAQPFKQRSSSQKITLIAAITSRPLSLTLSLQKSSGSRPRCRNANSRTTL